mgnify:CR=1 FL=1
MKILVVIPARGGSKGIPKKNIRLINGKPLISYSIKNALELKKENEVTVVVDTDDEEIAAVSEQNGATVITRPSELSGDTITLDPVIFHALIEMEKNNGEYDLVITMQATSPTLKSQTVQKAIKFFTEKKIDTLISGVNKPHLSWSEENNECKPNYTERLNRQFLPKHLCETGGFLITKRDCVTEVSRIGSKVMIYELSEDEAIDIDTEKDWIVCESILKSKKILLRADGEETLGMGHIYRAISIAYHLIGNEILFVTRSDKNMGFNKLKESFFPVETITDDFEIERIIQKYKPDIIINDILNTCVQYMKMLKKYPARIINFEDKGKGAEYADAVINSLYMKKSFHNEYVGFEYFFIRDEFLTAQPKNFSAEVKSIVVLFGGTDPNNLTQRTYNILKEVSKRHPKINFHIITGYGYKYKDVIKDDQKHNIYVHNNLKRVSKYLAVADLAITAQGRTIYELARMGVPSIVLAQNKRELEHEFAGMANGYINLGLGEKSSDNAIYSTIEWLISTPSVRKQMHDLLLKKDFRKGQDKVIKLILGE